MEQLFGLALGIASPWKITGVKFSRPEGEFRGLVEISIDFDRGARFLDGMGVSCAVHDTVRRSWQHLDFFQHKCLLNARVPRIRTSGGDVHTVEVPWARPGSSFTLLFVAFGMLLIRGEMPVSSVAEMLGVNDNRVWRFFNHWVGVARERQDLSNVKSVGVDEFCVGSGHQYNTVGVDMDTRKVIEVVEGKGAATVGGIAERIACKGGHPDKVVNISMDMSPSFISGAQTAFPGAAITFDKFHVVKVVHSAMDQVRREEQRECKELKKTRYHWLRNDQNLKEEHIERRNELAELYPTIGKAFRLKSLFKDFWGFKHGEQAETFLHQWCHEAEKSELPPFQYAAQTIRNHWQGIINHFTSKLNNGVLEGINNKIQLAKRRARGYRNPGNFHNMIHFIAGDLRFDHPLLTT
jgi:transposase